MQGDGNLRGAFKERRLATLVQAASPERPRRVGDGDGGGGPGTGCGGARTVDRVRGDARAVPPDRGDRARGARRVARVLGRHGRRPLPAVGPGAGSVGVRLERARCPRGAHAGRHRARRDCPDVPLAPGNGGAGVSDPRGHVPGSALARDRLRGGAQRARRRPVLARGAGAHQPHVRGGRAHQEAVPRLDRRSGRQARWYVLQVGVHPAVDHAGGGTRGADRDSRSRHGQARRARRRRAHHGRRAAREDRRAVPAVRRGRPGVRS